jgi:hypothetical protein
VKYLNKHALSIGSPTPELAKSAKDPGVPVFGIDLEQGRIEPALSSDVERYQWAERNLLWFTYEEARLRPALKGEPVHIDDRGALRMVIEAMRPMVSAAIEWARGPAGDDDFEQRAAETLHGVIVASWPRLAAAMSTAGERQPHEPPFACSGCGGAESVCNCPCGYHYCGCDCHRFRTLGAQP